MAKLVWLWKDEPDQRNKAFSILTGVVASTTSDWEDGETSVSQDVKKKEITD